MSRGVLGAGAIAVAAVLMVSLAWGLQHAALTNPQLLGRAAPELAIRQLDGAQLGVAQLKGQPVVINFWASWCGPCVEEQPVLSSASATHPKVAFVGVD